MADKEKKVKEAKADQKPEKKKFNFRERFSKFFKSIGGFFKSFRAEVKKVVWPDRKTVLRNTGVVLAIVLAAGLVIYLIDLGLTESIAGIKGLAEEKTSAIINSLFLM